MKVKLFGVSTDESILAKFGLGTAKTGLPELETEINQFIKDKKEVKIKIATAQQSYQNTLHAIMFAMVTYEEPQQEVSPKTANLQAESAPPSQI